jgi:hypothetical protein
MMGILQPTFATGKPLICIGCGFVAKRRVFATGRAQKSRRRAAAKKQLPGSG